MRKTNILIAQIAAIIAARGFSGLICFQILLAPGFPFRNAVWGGKYNKVPLSFCIDCLRQ